MSPLTSRVLHWFLHLALFGLFGVSVVNLLLLLILRPVAETTFDQAQRTLVIITTFCSGFVINIGTIIQTLATLMRKDVRLRYTECLLVGCLILFVSQIQLMLYEVYSIGQLTWDQIATPFTTFLSVVCTCAFHTVTKFRREEERQVKSYKLACVADTSATRVEPASQPQVENIRFLNETATPLQTPSPPPKRLIAAPLTESKSLVFLEGTAGIGKNLVCDESFDFSRYLSRAPIYLHKQEVPYIQSLYEGHIYADIIIELCVASGRRASGPGTTNKLRFTTEEVIFDRSPFAQLAYNIIFALNGERKSPFEYRNDFDKLIAIPELHNELRHFFAKWMDIMRWINGDVKLIWFGAQSAERTAARLVARSGVRKDCNLGNYIINQNYTFAKLCEISGFGNFYLTDSCERKYIRNLLEAERSAENIDANETAASSRGAIVNGGGHIVVGGSRPSNSTVSSLTLSVSSDANSSNEGSSKSRNTGSTSNAVTNNNANSSTNTGRAPLVQQEGVI